MKRRLKAPKDELKALQEKQDIKAKLRDEEVKAAQLKMH